MSEAISVAKVEQAIKEAAWDGNLSGGLQDKLLAFVADYRRLQAENAELVRERDEARAIEEEESERASAHACRLGAETLHPDSAGRIG